MTISIEDICRLYLKRDIQLAELRDWMALYQWDLSDYYREFADDIDVALAHLDDAYIDEDSLRSHLRSLLERRNMQVAKYEFELKDILPSPFTLHSLTSTSETPTQRVAKVVA